MRNLYCATDFKGNGIVSVGIQICWKHLGVIYCLSRTINPILGFFYEAFRTYNYLIAFLHLSRQMWQEILQAITQQIYTVEIFLMS